jgi:DnaJ-class molecular chaperone
MTYAVLITAICYTLLLFNIGELPFAFTSEFTDGVLHLNKGTQGLDTSPMPHVQVNIELPLTTVLTGISQNFTYTRTAICPHCKGRGALASDIKPCPVCSSDGNSTGSGIIEHNHAHSSGIQQMTRVTCEKCAGHGEIFDTPCTK